MVVSLSTNPAGAGCDRILAFAAGWKPLSGDLYANLYPHSSAAGIPFLRITALERGFHLFGREDFISLPCPAPVLDVKRTQQMPATALARIGLLAAVVAQPAVAAVDAASVNTASAFTVWTQAQYGEADQNRRGGVPGYGARLQNVAVGVAGSVSESWRLGLDYRVLQAELERAGQELLRIDGEFVKATARFSRGRYALALGLSHGRAEHDSPLPASDSSATVRGADALLSYRYPLQGTVVVEPLLQVRYVRSEMDDPQPVHEIGEAGIGVRWRGHFQAGPGRLEQRIRLMALRDYIADADGATSLVMLGDQAVLTHPARPQRHSYQAGLGMSYHLGSLTLSVGYDYLERTSYHADSLSVEVRYDF